MDGAPDVPLLDTPDDAADARRAILALEIIFIALKNPVCDPVGVFFAPVHLSIDELVALIAFANAVIVCENDAIVYGNNTIV